MDERDLDKAASKLRQQTARTSPPPSSNDGRAAASRPPSDRPAHTSTPSAVRWAPAVRPVPTLVDICTRSLCDHKLTYVARPLPCCP
jgi:hypothetical protein